MALSLSNLLTEYKLALRDSDETDENCYAALNSSKDEFQAKAISMVKTNALASKTDPFLITLVADTYSYSLSTASPTIGQIIDVYTNNGNGDYYVPMRQVDKNYQEGMEYDPYNMTYRINGNYIDIQFAPGSGYIKIYYAPQIYTVSDSYTGSGTMQSYQTDEVDRAWAWYSASKKFESEWQDKRAAVCMKRCLEKLLLIPRGWNV